MMSILVRTLRVFHRWCRQHFGEDRSTIVLCPHNHFPDKWSSCRISFRCHKLHPWDMFRNCRKIPLIEIFRGFVVLRFFGDFFLFSFFFFFFFFFFFWGGGGGGGAFCAGCVAVLGLVLFCLIYVFRCKVLIILLSVGQVRSGQVRVFNVHIQSKLL